ncbi:type I restriction endonuclease subunit R [Methanococcoides alaskense]|uniref:Type I restriction enzyme R subunit n=1 Tax=Methanococcoides alaskense TaxID=325778 RepID=A0AA90TXL7_9EURY|nr:type I restriction endonuclease [Methanococcoides alaskense]MDA0525166.1 type I restriction endonuclease [Methanococcoides alaskense]MDR6221913.1 type I restriction enzyme R subunit [Methanococcoides alaskense]
MTSTQIHTEKAFEEAIESHLLEEGGYKQGNPANYDKELALDKGVMLSFLKESQPDKWDKSVSIHGGIVETKVLKRLQNELDNKGMLDVLRNGFTDMGVHYDTVFFKPVSGLNPETQKLYRMNNLTVTRQVHYSLKSEKSIDMLLSINGLPVATVELKNQFTGQNVDNAKKQFMFDREPNELLFKFKKRALVHFAVDTDEAYMTTKLTGKTTRYLPFNRGCDGGEGNPVNPHGYRTSYLWEQVWEKDSWLDIIGRFLHLQVEKYEMDGKLLKKESMIFPRFHQLDVVRKLSADTHKNGSGKNYLIEHSAGSGKSNSIAWLAYHLSCLYDNDDNRVFDSVVVITDRRVLDKQLQDTIFQFEHTQGVVQKIDKDSKQLASALNSGTNIIITTLQKFPFIIDKVEDMPARKYAVIVDEAHSSQGGKSSEKMKVILAATDMDTISKEGGEEDDDAEDQMRKVMASRGQQKNLSFYAFTATPKSKTLDVFGTEDESGQKKPFHLYSMRQAIEEGFIMDVLKNYVTYKTFFELSKTIEDDPSLNKKKAKRAAARFVSLHPYNIAQKTEVMIEHFRQVTMKKIGGQAKAMVVTSSRPHVVKYKQEFDRYIKEKGYSDIKALVAFSGTVTDEYSNSFTEPEMNGFSEKELPEKFNTEEYRLLLVAEKYQTGFDQPLLHTMYVDKALSGVKAVQTLSRLNRTHAGKEDTFILDFVNDKDDILLSFQPYYQQTSLSESTNPNLLYDLKGRLESAQVFWQTEVNNFCNVFFRSENRHTQKDNAQLNAYIDPAVERYRGIAPEEEQEDFRHTLTSFVRLYSFLSQIMPFQDMELEKLYAYGRMLLKKLPRTDNSKMLKLDDEVALEYYRLQKINEGSISLQPENGVLDPTSEAGMRKEKEELAHLSEIIKVLNDRFGTDFTDADRLFFEQIEADLVANEGLSKQARNNTVDNFKFGFEDVFTDVLIGRMEQNGDIFAKIMDDTDFASKVKEILIRSVYKKLNEEVVALSS